MSGFNAYNFFTSFILTWPKRLGESINVVWGPNDITLSAASKHPNNIAAYPPAEYPNVISLLYSNVDIISLRDSATSSIVLPWPGIPRKYHENNISFTKIQLYNRIF
jgi:hypothetical protein